MSQILKIKASLISKLAGFNRYCTRDEIFEELLNSNPWLIPKLKLQQHRHYSTSTERELAKLSSEELKNIGSSLGLNIQNLSQRQILAKLTQTLASCVQTTCEQTSKDTLRQFLEKNTTIKDKLSKCLEQDIRIKRGCYQESRCLNQFETSTEIPVINRNTKLYQKQLFDCYRDFVVNVVGRVDGMSADGSTVIETKQRRNGFFDKIPIYEKVQLETYLWLTDLKQAIHIQNYDKQQRPVMYLPDPELWTDVMQKLQKFIETEIVEKID